MAMAMIPLIEYARRHGKDPGSMRRKAIHGGFETAQKLGRDWIIDEDEPLTDHRVRSGAYRDWRKGHKEVKTMKNMMMINMDSFGDNCPENWEEIADYLNDRIEQATFDLDPVEDADEIRNLIDEIWSGYCERCRDGQLEDDEPMPIYGDGDQESICICTINMSDGDGRQTISYNPEEGRLYSSSQEEPLDITVNSLQEAEDACRAMWGQDCWGLRWFFWWAVDDATTKRAQCDSEKLDAQTKIEAVKEARAMFTRLTPHDRRERDAFWVGYAPEDEDGYMDFDAVKVKIDIK